MKKYEKKGYSEKEALNIPTEEQKLCDIEFLKKQNPPGPFTRSHEVSHYLGSDNNDVVKNKRLYIEVRLAKTTCLSLKPSSSIFRLKRAGRKLSSDEYANNLISYLDNSYSQTSITITDLQKVLTALNQEQLPEKQTNLNLMCFRPGDYVAAFWIDSSGKYKWHLANVVEICSNDTFLL